MTQALKQRFPELQVEGGNFPPSQTNTMIATALSYGKLLAIAALIIADARVPAGEGPEWFDWMRTNKVSVGVG